MDGAQVLSLVKELDPTHCSQKILHAATKTQHSQISFFFFNCSMGPPPSIATRLRTGAESVFSSDIPLRAYRSKQAFSEDFRMNDG